MVDTKFQKGREKTGGRVKGVQNKATIKTKEAISALVDNNSEKIDMWLNEIYKDKGAQGALDAFMGFLEYHQPKLSRTEHAGDAENPISHDIMVKFE